jgi:hypothetical protein
MQLAHAPWQLTAYSDRGSPTFHQHFILVLVAISRNECPIFGFVMLGPPVVSSAHDARLDRRSRNGPAWDAC